MKHLPLLLILGLALSLCNLSNRLKFKQSTNSASGNTSATDSGGTIAEKAEPTAAQTAALAGGQQIKWDPQGISWTVPPKWTEASNESKMFVWRSPGGGDAASLIVNISPMDENFPAELSIKAFYDGAKGRAKNGEVDELKWLEIDGVKGVEFRESNPEKPDGFRRLQWMAYRKFAGQVQLVNVMLATSGKGFPNHQDAMYGILYSMKLVH
ncbi:MAG TPA: hypothetical protein VKB46_24070 [Pyrinomonadaceae bacterium]|nr:hypothetical protein [Pyrinomonadaceae bacterium]